MLKDLLASKSRPTVVGLLIYFLAFYCEKVVTTNVITLYGCVSANDFCVKSCMLEVLRESWCWRSVSFSHTGPSVFPNQSLVCKRRLVHRLQHRLKTNRQILLYIYSYFKVISGLFLRKVMCLFEILGIDFQ